MIKLDEVRQEVIAAFKAVHEANYPSTKVNYPNFVLVDLEHQTEPFVSVELDLTATERSAIGERDLLVPGSLIVYFYYREGEGMSGSMIYTDMLNEYLGMGTIGSLQFHVAKPVPVTTFPGWKGTMNTMRFDVVQPTGC